jgi:hypothetical protein
LRESRERQAARFVRFDPLKKSRTQKLFGDFLVSVGGLGDVEPDDGCSHMAELMETRGSGMEGGMGDGVTVGSA